MPADPQTTRTFVCQGCGKVSAVLYGAKVKCSCGTTSAAQIDDTQTTEPLGHGFPGWVVCRPCQGSGRLVSGKTCDCGGSGVRKDGR